METRADLQPKTMDRIGGQVDDRKVPVDGRTARAIRTHDAIVDACIDLVSENDLRPTAHRIAERAGVSVRSVFQHFDDLERLYAAVAERAGARVARLVSPIDPALPLEARIQALVGQRAELFEALSPIRRAADVHAPFSKEIKRRLKEGYDGLRAQVATVFAAELMALPDRESEVFHDALDVCLAWPTWDVLRTMHGRSIESCEEVLTLQVRALVEAATRSA